MTVCVNKSTDLRGHGSDKDARCTFCGGMLFYPFLCWDTLPHGGEAASRVRGSDGVGHILLCSRCCSKIKKGLIADLIHLEAAREITGLYPELTLVRENGKQLDERQEREIREMGK
jgi:hypothetical protein